MAESRALFYPEDSPSSLVPITHPDDSYPQVISRIIEFLGRVQLQPDIANQIEELWIPGPRYACKPNENLEHFPDEVIRLIEAEITRCIQPQYLNYYLKEGWQDTKCLSTVTITATIIFLLPNVKTLQISGGHSVRQYSGGRYSGGQTWGAETFYKLIKSLETHQKPDCKILQKLENANIRWTITSQTTFEFLEWLAGLPTINSIQADGISTQVMHISGGSLAPKTSSLTRFEFCGRIHGTETLKGLLQAARSLKCFIYHSSSNYEKDKGAESDVEGHALCSVLSDLTDRSLLKLKTDLGMSVESLSKLQRLTHLWVQLDTVQLLEVAGEVKTAFSLPASLEHLILPQKNWTENGNVAALVRAVANAKDTRWPSLKTLTLVSDCYTSKALKEWVECATKDLAKAGVEFHYCVNKSGKLPHGGSWTDFLGMF